jgi:hypothetical protein
MRFPIPFDRARYPLFYNFAKYPAKHAVDRQAGGMLGFFIIGPIAHERTKFHRVTFKSLKIE